MSFEDIVAIIFVIIFFVGPLIKRIAEAAGKQEDSPRKGRSLEEVREYLERMKSSQTSSSEQTQYRAPATTPYRPSSKEKGSAKKRGVKEEVVVQPAVVPIVIEAEPETPSVKTAIEKNVLHDFMISTRFTEAQKAIILAEIFRQPSI